MKWFGKKGDEETFIRLIQLAREDSVIHEKLTGLLALESFHRNSALSTCIREMKMTKAPKNIIAAFEILLDDEAAQKAHEILMRDE